MNRFFLTYFPNIKNPVGRIAGAILVILVITLVLMTAGYFSGKALYYFTHN